MVYNVIGRILVIAPNWFVKTASWKSGAQSYTVVYNSLKLRTSVCQSMKLLELACCPSLQHKNCDNAADGKHT